MPLSNKISFKKTLIIGLGLIGGSLAKAIRNYRLSSEIFAFDLNSEAVELAKKQGTIDGFFPLEDSLSGFDFIVLASPISTYKEIFKKLLGKISVDALIIDLGSVKNLKIKNLPKNFVPCHPIAGSEKAGFENSQENLFLNKKFVICAENCLPESIKKIENLVEKIGAKPDFIDAKQHDEIYALVSHLPQFLSFLTAEFSPKNLENEFLKTAFRLDNSNPEIWSEIFKFNEKNLEKFYLKFFENLQTISSSLILPSKIEDLLNQDLRPFLERSSVLLHKTKYDDSDFKDEEFFEKFIKPHFPTIFFRLLLVLSYLQIPEIKTFQGYAGSGFRDFTSIVEILNFNPKKLEELLQKNRQKILKLLASIQ